MNDRQLHSFLLTADYSSFAKAASASYISTSALISQISLLERDTGLVLFKRNPRGIELTREGEVFYDYAARILAMYEEGMKVAHMAGEEDRSRISILGGDLNFTHTFKMFCLGYMERNPGVKITYEERPFGELYEAFAGNPSALLGSGRAKAQYESQFDYLPLFEDQLMLLVPDGHQLAGQESLTPEDLKGYDLLGEKHVIDALDYGEMFRDIPGVNLSYCAPFHSELPILNAFSNNQLVLRPKRWSCFALDLIKEVPIRCDANMTVGIYSHKDCPKYIRDFIDAYRRR